MVTLAAVFIRTNGRFTHLAVTRSTTRCTRSPRIPCFSCPGTLCSRLLRIPHARPALRLPAHAAPSHTDTVAPAPNRKCPAEHQCRLAARAVATSTTHYHLAQPNPQRSRLPLSPIRVHPSRPCPDRRGREPLLVYVTRTPRVPGTRVCEPGELLCPPPALVDSPSRGASVPAGAPRRAAEGGTPMRGWPGSECQEVSERSLLEF